jgi:uncharacterized protein (DUF1800 family)
MKQFLTAMVALALLTAATPSTKLTERQRAEHALNRLGFGPRPGDIDRVAAMGVDKWIDQQLHPERIDDSAVETRLASFETLKKDNADLLDQYYKPIVALRKEKKEGEEVDTEEMKAARQKSQRVVGELVAQRIVRATESDRQLNEVMADFWLNHFNVFAGKGIDRFLLTSYERDTIRPHIWGKFEDLLMATAKSPAMMFYLDNARSRNGAINENYAREIMELHTLGVDGGYTQKDVTELARVFTGWSIGRPQGREKGPQGRENGPQGRGENEGTFMFRPFAHDRGEKTVLGVHFKAGGGIEEGEQMIHMLAHHPATAHHIALQLCQRLVADDPPKALVDRVAGVFLKSDGDLRATVKAVIDSREFWDSKVYRAKVKTPFEYVMSALRASDAKVVNPIPVARALQQIGEPLYGAQPPTGYSDKAEAWINSGAEVNRMNFAVDLASNKLPGVVVKTADANKLALELGSPEFQKQ